MKYNQDYLEVCLTVHFKTVTTTMAITIADPDEVSMISRIASVIEAMGTSDIMVVGDGAVDMTQVSGITFHGKEVHYDAAASPAYTDKPLTRLDMEMLLKRVQRMVADKLEKQ